MVMGKLFFDDFHVGQRFTSREAELTRDRIVAFGEEIDPQPQHIDGAQAATSNFGELRRQRLAYGSTRADRQRWHAGRSG